MIELTDKTEEIPGNMTKDATDKETKCLEQKKLGLEENLKLSPLVEQAVLDGRNMLKRPKWYFMGISLQIFPLQCQ